MFLVKKLNMDMETYAYVYATNIYIWNKQRSSK